MTCHYAHHQEGNNGRSLSSTPPYTFEAKESVLRGATEAAPLLLMMTDDVSVCINLLTKTVKGRQKENANRCEKYLKKVFFSGMRKIPFHFLSL
jgi:hypothetical protein